MIQVSLDTSFLISFADPDRPNHVVAVDFSEGFTQGRLENAAREELRLPPP
jgi:hypothetical protein